MARTAGFNSRLSLRAFCLIRLLLILLIVAPIVRSQSGSEIIYLYDELGRLVAVIDLQGETATYTYDAVGNLLSISHHSSSELSIIEFTPNTGPIGTVVTIYGTGFSSVPAQNSVSFNGVAASVSSATANQITTVVPAGATTGPITVTTSSGTATSSTSFIVGDSAAPTITGFTPTIGSAGTSVTITGTNFESDFYKNRTEFNQSLAAITSATTTTIATSVPSGATSGRISVGTPAGTAFSDGDFFVPPSPYTASDVQVTGRMAIGETKVVTISAANKVGIIVFDGVAGQRVSLGMSGVTIGAPYCCDVASATIYKPNGTLLSPFGFGTAGNGTPSQVLPVTGTYSIVVDPYNTNTGSVTLILSEDLAVPIIVNGASVPLDFSRVGQNARATFEGTAGQRVSLGINGMTLVPTYCCDVASVAFYKPDGTVMLSPVNFSNSGMGTATQVLPVTGTYSIIVDPFLGRTGSMTLTLSEDLAPPITINGPPVSLTFRAGQNARLTFDGTVGQRVSLGINGMTLVPTYCCEVASVGFYKPDGTVLLAPFNFSNSGAETTSQVLPVTGTYSLLVDPFLARTGNITLSLSGDLTGTIIINGAPMTLEFRTAQNAQLTFDGTAGQRVSLGMSGLTLAPGYCCDVASAAFYKPDGTVLLSPYGFTNAGAGTASQMLPVTGTYSIIVDPYVGRNGNMTVTLSEDLAPPISINGPAVTLDFRVGQNARLTFDGTAGQRVSLGMSGLTLAPGYCCDVASVAFYKPDGAVLLSPYSFTNTGAGTATQVLPVTGTYSIIVDPYLGRNGNMTVTLSEDLAPPISINSPPLTLDFRSGQNARLTFDGTAGQRVSLGMSGLTLAPGYCCDVASVALYKPDGTVLLSPYSFTNAGAGTVSQVLPVTGIYSIIIDPYLGRNGSMTLTLSEDLPGPITINGAPLTLNFNRVGQNASVSFNGTAGQQVTVRVAGNIVGNIAVKLLRPDGSQITSATSSSVNFNLTTQTLATTGSYSITVDPPGVATGSLSLELDIATTNLALNRTATQSSTNYSAPASRAVDGNTDGYFWNGSVTHTQVESQPWWHVDLGSVQAISRINLWNRTDCCSEALTNFYVFVSDVPFTSTDLTTTQNQPGVWTYHNSGPAGPLTSLLINRTGRYIRVQLAGVERLSLTEVQVWP